MLDSNRMCPSGQWFGKFFYNRIYAEKFELDIGQPMKWLTAQIVWRLEK